MLLQAEYLCQYPSILAASLDMIFCCVGHRRYMNTTTDFEEIKFSIFCHTLQAKKDMLYPLLGDSHLQSSSQHIERVKQLQVGSLAVRQRQQLAEQGR